MSKRKATPAQIAWRKKFAQMAKSGTFSKRQKNPKTRTRTGNVLQLTRPSERMDVPAYQSGKESALRQAIRLVKRRMKTMSAPEGFYANPRALRPSGYSVFMSGKLVATFKDRAKALEYARALANARRQTIAIEGP